MQIKEKPIAMPIILPCLQKNTRNLTPMVNLASVFAAASNKRINYESSDATVIRLYTYRSKRCDKKHLITFSVHVSINLGLPQPNH